MTDAAPKHYPPAGIPERGVLTKAQAREMYPVSYWRGTPPWNRLGCLVFAVAFFLGGTIVGYGIGS